MQKSKIIVTFVAQTDEMALTLREIGVVKGGMPIVMGILNCTPDSFFESSRKTTERDIAHRAEEIISQGGRIIDIGAYSTRPGAMEVTVEEEMRRMRMALQTVRMVTPDGVLSIDTFTPEVARMAVEEFGAQIINDVAEGRLVEEAARLKVPYVLMSQKSDIDSSLRFFDQKVTEMKALGQTEVILDLGYGFGKDVILGNYSIMAQQHRVGERFPDLPLLVGISRKRMIYQLLGTTADSELTLQGTKILNMMALAGGADVLRVHDVKEAVECFSHLE